MRQKKRLKMRRSKRRHCFAGVRKKRNKPLAAKGFCKTLRNLAILYIVSGGDPDGIRTVLPA